jgi:hypothetical protein
MIALRDSTRELFHYIIEQQVVNILLIWYLNFLHQNAHIMVNIINQTSFLTHLREAQEI